MVYLTNIDLYSLIKKIIKLCIQYNKIIIADPKKIDLNCYNGINILTPNQKEITDTAKKNFLNDENLFKFAKKIVLKKNVYVNKGKKNQKKIINLKNPMSDYLKQLLKNLNNKELLSKNNYITIKSTQIMEKLLNF